MGIDRKYGRVTTEHGTIGEDEPVVVFRAKDKMLPDLLDVYLGMCGVAGSPEKHIAGIEATRAEVMAWQETHFTQVPQSSGEESVE